MLLVLLKITLSASAKMYGFQGTNVILSGITYRERNLLCRCAAVAVHCRLAGSEVGSNADVLSVPASEDPLACLQQQQQGPNELALHNPAALDYLDHRLMVTDDVRALLAVLAPWLAEQQPFLLVSGDECTSYHMHTAE
jgi:hypothetical protein